MLYKNFVTNTIKNTLQKATLFKLFNKTSNTPQKHKHSKHSTKLFRTQYKNFTNNSEHLTQLHKMQVYKTSNLTKILYKTPKTLQKTHTKSNTHTKWFNKIVTSNKTKL